MITNLNYHAHKRELELKLAREALRQTDGNKIQAAALMGVSLPTMRCLAAAVEQNRELTRA